MGNRDVSIAVKTVSGLWLREDRHEVRFTDQHGGVWSMLDDPKTPHIDTVHYTPKTPAATIAAERLKKLAKTPQYQKLNTALFRHAVSIGVKLTRKLISDGLTHQVLKPDLADHLVNVPRFARPGDLVLGGHLAFQVKPGITFSYDISLIDERRTPTNTSLEGIAILAVGKAYPAQSLRDVRISGTLPTWVTERFAFPAIAAMTPQQMFSSCKKHTPFPMTTKTKMTARIRTTPYERVMRMPRSQGEKTLQRLAQTQRKEQVWFLLEPSGKLAEWIKVGQRHWTLGVTYDPRWLCQLPARVQHMSQYHYHPWRDVKRAPYRATPSGADIEEAVMAAIKLAYRGLTGVFDVRVVNGDGSIFTIGVNLTLLRSDPIAFRNGIRDYFHYYEQSRKIIQSISDLHVDAPNMKKYLQAMRGTSIKVKFHKVPSSAPK